MIVLEIFMLMLRQNRRRKRPKPLAMLDARVQHIFHIWQPGMRDDRSIAQRSRSPLHASLKPSDDIALRDLIGDCLQQRLAFQLRIAAGRRS